MQRLSGSNVGRFFVAALFFAITTGYAPAAGGVNCDGDCSVTAYGYTPGPSIAACGRAYRGGDVLHVDGYGTVVCADRFGANVRPTRIDLWFATRDAALRWGARQVEVRQLTHYSLSGFVH